MVLLDPDYLKDRKVFGHVLAAFRYGREDLDVLGNHHLVQLMFHVLKFSVLKGLTFRKDLYLASAQIYPPEPSNKKPLSRLQVLDALVATCVRYSVPDMRRPLPNCRSDW